MKDHVRGAESKEFAFTKLMVCGLCGSGVSAAEKFKRQKNGNIHRYVYYGCTKAIDKNCKCGYIEEEILIIKQFKELIDKVSINEIGMQHKIKAEVERFKKFQRSVLGVKEKIEVGEIDIRNYAKYILQDGTIAEKRELFSCFNSKILFKEKKVCLENN